MVGRGGDAAFSDSLVIAVGREMSDDLPDPGPIEEKNSRKKNGSHDSHGSHRG